MHKHIHTCMRHACYIVTISLLEHFCQIFCKAYLFIFIFFFVEKRVLRFRWWSCDKNKGYVSKNINLNKKHK